MTIIGPGMYHFISHHLIEIKLSLKLINNQFLGALIWTFHFVTVWTIFVKESPDVPGIQEKNFLKVISSKIRPVKSSF